MKPNRFYLMGAILPNLKISQAADAGTLLSSDMIPLARAGDTNGYHATMTEVATFTNASVSSGAYNNTGRNLLHNTQFTIAQRGPGPFTTGGAYTLDRWSNFGVHASSGSLSISQYTIPDVGRAAIGDETAEFALQFQFVGGTGTNDQDGLAQRIEDVRRLGGKTVTVSFWASATSGTPKIGVGIFQNFGTGGSPSASVTVNATPVTISTSWARYSVTLSVPSTTGKTLGTNVNHFTELDLYVSAGATSNTAAGGIGVQSNTIWFWGMQLEIGSVATPLAKRDPFDEFAVCQRFYQAGIAQLDQWAGAAGAFYAVQLMLPVVMRGVPTITANITTQTNCSGSGVWTVGTWTTGYQVGTNATAVGQFNMSGTWIASADL